MKSLEKWSWLGNAAPVVAVGVVACSHWHHPTREMETPPEPMEEPSPVALDKRRRVGFELIGRKSLTRDTVLLRFALPSSEHVLGLPSGQHLFCYAVINGETIVRAYSTITPPETKGYFEIALRVYFAGQNERYPLGGKMSQVRTLTFCVLSLKCHITCISLKVSCLLHFTINVTSFVFCSTCIIFHLVRR